MARQGPLGSHFPGRDSGSTWPAQEVWGRWRLTRREERLSCPAHCAQRRGLLATEGFQEVSWGDRPGDWRCDRDRGFVRNGDQPPG